MLCIKGCFRHLSTEFSIHTLPDVKEWMQITISYEKKKKIYYYTYSLDVFSLFQRLNNTEKKVWDLNPGHLPVFILSMS